MTQNQKLKLQQFLFIFLLVVVLLLLGYNYFARPFEKRFTVVPELKQVIKNNIIDTPLNSVSVLGELSVKQRVAQMVAQPTLIASDSAITMTSTPVGFVTIFGKNISSDSAKLVVSSFKRSYSTSKVLDSFTRPMFIVDHEGGSVQRLNGKGYTTLPSWQELCKMETSKSPSNEFNSLVRKSALELKQTGIDIVLAPLLDVGKNSVLKDRICSDSYIVVADKSTAFIDIFNSLGILPVVKHFPGIGSVKTDLHKQFSSITVSTEDVYLYRHVLQSADEVGVMISHVGVKNQDDKLPCSLSASCVEELTHSFPEILVFSDALEMKSALFNKDNISEPKTLLEVSKEAVLAGDEVLIYGQGVTTKELDEVVTSLSSEYRKNATFSEKVDRAVLKILEYKHEK